MSCHALSFLCVCIGVLPCMQCSIVPLFKSSKFYVIPSCEPPWKQLLRRTPPPPPPPPTPLHSTWEVLLFTRRTQVPAPSAAPLSNLSSDFHFTLNTPWFGKANLEVAPGADEITRVTGVLLQTFAQQVSGDFHDADGVADLCLVMCVVLFCIH